METDEYYKRIYEAYLCLDSDRANKDWSNFTPMLCRQITWAIIDGGREYFAQTMLPDAFNVPLGTPIRYPQSSLDELVRAIKNQSPVYKANFPTQWVPLREGMGGTNTIARQIAASTGAYTLATQGGTLVGTVVTGTRASTQASTTMRSTASSLTNPTNTGGNPCPQSREIRPDNIHPLIKQNFGPHFQKFGQLQLTRLMMLSKVTWPQMPTIPKYMDGTVNKLCYNFVLGRCTSRYCTHKSGHAPVEDVTLTFAHNICNHLGLGLKTMTEALMTAPWPEFQAIIAERQQQAAPTAG